MTESRTTTPLKPAAPPQRTCVGCRRTDDKARLRRLVLDGAGRLQPQLDRRPQPGRGAYVHPDEKCLIVALSRGGFDRAFRRKVVTPPRLKETLSHHVLGAFMPPPTTANNEAVSALALDGAADEVAVQGGLRGSGGSGDAGSRAGPIGNTQSQG